MPKPNRITIKTIRELRKLSQRELGRRIGVSSGYVSRVEKGSVTPTHTMCERMAAELEVPVEVLTGDAS